MQQKPQLERSKTASTPAVAPRSTLDDLFDVRDVLAESDRIDAMERLTDTEVQGLLDSLDFGLGDPSQVELPPLAKRLFQKSPRESVEKRRHRPKKVSARGNALWKAAGYGGSLPNPKLAGSAMRRKLFPKAKKSVRFAEEKNTVGVSDVVGGKFGLRTQKAWFYVDEPPTVVRDGVRPDGSELLHRTVHRGLRTIGQRSRSEGLDAYQTRHLATNWLRLVDVGQADRAPELMRRPSVGHALAGTVPAPMQVPVTHDPSAKAGKSILKRRATNGRVAFEKEAAKQSAVTRASIQRAHRKAEILALYQSRMKLKL